MDVTVISSTKVWVEWLEPTIFSNPWASFSLGNRQTDQAVTFVPTLEMQPRGGTDGRIVVVWPLQWEDWGWYLYEVCIGVESNHPTTTGLWNTDFGSFVSSSTYLNLTYPGTALNSSSSQFSLLPNLAKILLKAWDNWAVTGNNHIYCVVAALFWVKLVRSGILILSLGSTTSLFTLIFKVPSHFLARIYCRRLLGSPLKKMMYMSALFAFLPVWQKRIADSIIDGCKPWCLCWNSGPLLSHLSGPFICTFFWFV